MEWLIDRDDPYFEIAKDVAKLDWQELPNVTHLVTLNVSKEVWRRNLNIRNRELDSNSNLLNSYSTQEYFVAAAEELSREFGIEHIRINVDEKTVGEVAYEIVNKISVKETIVS
ncbi:hypothetical protein G6H54_002181 [Listeria monocytogenes]|nr:hypothetical protein [Listeria monocytogenes]EEO7553713.1 hypothetical protein [Listeria monocytogenes]EEO9089449.1 hypothetical protein [Listeria monocytogenes]